MKASLQARILALVGAGVFAAAVLLSLLSRSTLLSLEAELQHDHDRLASALARELSRAVGDDLRLVSGLDLFTLDRGTTELEHVAPRSRLASGAFVFGAGGELVGCAPAIECAGIDRPALAREAGRVIALQRPAVSDAPVAASRVAALIPFPARDGYVAAGAGVIIDPGSRRLRDLLDAREISPALHVKVLTGTGTTLAESGRAPAAVAYDARVPVAGTPWTLVVSEGGADPSAPIASFRRRSLWLAPGLAALATFLAWGIARSVRRPLMALTSAAERIAGGGLAEPVDRSAAEDGGSEVARLARALETMRAALERSMQEIEATNRDLEVRIADRTKALAEANERLLDRERMRQQLLRQVISAQEDERKRVARELHDETSQALAALGLGVDLAIGRAGGEVRTQLVALRTLVTHMHAGVERLIVNLRPSVLDDLGLAAAIRSTAASLFRDTGISVRCELSDLEDRLPAEIEVATFRAVQEALVNVLRHARAETVLVQGTVTASGLEIEIEDDGVGFEPSRLERSPASLRGIGVLGMRERMEILGGAMEIESSPGGGTRVRFSVPIPAAVHS